MLDRKSYEVSTYMHRKAGTAPLWNATFACDVNDAERDTFIVTVHTCIDVKSGKTRPPSVFVGRARISVMALAVRAAVEQSDVVEWDLWLSLLDRFADTQSNSTVQRGRIHVLLRYELSSLVPKPPVVFPSSNHSSAVPIQSPTS